MATKHLSKNQMLKARLSQLCLNSCLYQVRSQGTKRQIYWGGGGGGQEGQLPLLPVARRQPRSQGFSLFVIGKAGKGPGTGRSHDFQHPDIVGVINYNNNELENPRWPPTQECPQNLSA